MLDVVVITCYFDVCIWNINIDSFSGITEENLLKLFQHAKIPLDEAQLIYNIKHLGVTVLQEVTCSFSMPVNPCIHSFIYSSTHSLFQSSNIHSFIHSSIHSLFQSSNIHSFIHSSIHSLFQSSNIHSFIHSSIHSLFQSSIIHSFIHSSIHYFNHPTFTLSFIHQYIHYFNHPSFTHSFIHQYIHYLNHPSFTHSFIHQYIHYLNHPSFTHSFIHQYIHYFNHPSFRGEEKNPRKTISPGRGGNGTPQGPTRCPDGLHTSRTLWRFSFKDKLNQSINLALVYFLEMLHSLNEQLCVIGFPFNYCK